MELIPVLEAIMEDQQGTDLLLQLRFVHATLIKSQLAENDDISVVKENMNTLASLEATLPSLHSVDDRLGVLTSLSCISTQSLIAHALSQSSVPRVLVEWLETDAKNDGLVIKVLSLLSTLVEMEELDAALSERALGVVARRLRSSNVKYDLLLSVAVFLEAACNAS